MACPCACRMCSNVEDERLSPLSPRLSRSPALGTRVSDPSRLSPFLKIRYTRCPSSKKDSFRNTPLHAAASRRSQLSRHEVPHAHKSRRIRRPPPCLSSPHDADVTHLSSSERSEGKRQKEGPRGVGCDLRPSFPPKVPSSPCVVPPPLTTCHADHRRLCCGALREAQRFTAPPAQEPTIYSSDCAARLERRVA